MKTLLLKIIEMQNKYKILPPFLILAPMDDVTDSPFRSIIRDLSPPDLFFTEFTNVDGLQSKGQDIVKQKLYNYEESNNLIAQIWGLKPENFYITAQQIAKGKFGKFLGVDLNMGCPDKSITKNGACSALIKNRDLAKDIIQSTKEGLNNQLPLSVKTRLGYNEIDYSWHEFLLNQEIDMLIIHGRTKSQMSKTSADWNAINEIRKLRDKISPTTLIVGNGDVVSYRDALKKAQKYSLDGIMIGRGIFSDPYVFSLDSSWNTLNIDQRLNIFKKHINYFRERWASQKPVYILNKFCKVYINNFDGSKSIREELMSSKSIDELIAKIKEIELKFPG